MYNFLDEYVILRLTKYLNINDSINLLSQNKRLYNILNNFNYKFKYDYINTNQLCVKCFKVSKESTIIILCDNHKNYPICHYTCQKRKYKSIFQLDECVYCHQKVFSVKS